VKFRLRTLQVVVAVAAAPIWALRDGAMTGCTDRVILIWGTLVATPMLLMCLVLPWIRTKPTRERILAFFGAIVIVGYVIAIPSSWLAIGIFVP